MSSPFETPSAELTGGGVLRPCKGCGQEIHITVATCPHCGSSQRSSRYKGKVAAALLAFFLGGLGIHRFYLGQWWGLFYLLFFWTMIPGLVAFIEFIVFLVRSQEKWDEIYNDGMPAGPNEQGSTALIVGLAIVGIFVIIGVIGILAAIAIPQYADYTYRAKVSNAIVQTPPVKQAIMVFYTEHNILPDSNIMAGIEEPYLVDGQHSIRVTPDGFELSFGGHDSVIASKTIEFAPYLDEAGNVLWDCTGGTLDHRYRPMDCRP